MVLDVLAAPVPTNSPMYYLRKRGSQYWKYIILKPGKKPWK